LTTLSAVVPATNVPATLERCLASILAADEPPEELIVVDTPRNEGPARARNSGASSATQDVLVFVDADVEVARDAFRRVRAAFDEDPTLAAVFGSYDDDPAAKSSVSRFRNLLHHHVHHESAGPASTFWAGLGAIRREVFLAAGGFDADRFREASIEDIELGVRLAMDHEKIVLDPAIQGKHLKRWTLPSMVHADFRRRGVPWVRLLLEHKADSTTLNLGWRQRVSAAAAVTLLAALALRRPRIATVAAVFVVVLNRRFYLLLLRRGGWRLCSVGMPLHVLHQLVSAAAVPAGVVAHVRTTPHREARNRSS
jgi:GT2 family glycosyltransferase